MNRFLRLTLTGTLATACFFGAALAEARKDVPIDPADMDRGTRPAEDFYQYANGSWTRNNPMPDEYARWTTFDRLRDRNLEDLRKLMEEAAAAAPSATKGSNVQKIGDFFRLAMDEAKVNSEGAAPIKAELDAIAALATPADVQRYITTCHARGLSPLFGVGAAQDEKNSEMVIAVLAQGGIGLPDRDYYVSKEPRFAEMRKAYQRHVINMFRLLGEDQLAAARHAAAVMRLETRLAGASMTRLEERDPYKVYNKMPLARLQTLVPAVEWSAYFRGIGVPNPGDVNVMQPLFFKEVSRMFKDVSLEDWKSYLRWNILHEAAPFLSDNFVNENFSFYGQYLSGRKVIQPRWKRAITATSGSLGELVGQLYVERYFPAEAKTRMTELVLNLKKALRSRIEKLEWMSESTRKAATEKLDGMKFKIGYPDKWIDYSSLEVGTDSYAANALRAGAFEFRRQMAKVNKPVDRSEWEMTPQTVNAYYHPLLNEIVFPAAILQPPFFYRDGDDAVNYGAIGAVIGHEMTHGFDDQGRQYDSKGNLRDWWTAEDSKKFQARTELLVKQYSAMELLPGAFVDGKLTLGENIADLGGVTVGFEAYKMSLAGKPAPAPIDGLTAEQRFFVAFSRLWAGNVRDKELLRLIKEDVHSPARARATGPLVNFAPFYEAFGVKQGDKMFRTETERAKIW